ncbi:MAG: hypothetical protein AB1540_02465 [Bdellovibrionota bacterium]
MKLFKHFTLLAITFLQFSSQLQAAPNSSMSAACQLLFETLVPESEKKSRDAFLRNLPVKPKSHIAQYVAEHGIAIPVIYPSLDAALSSGKTIYFRTEHPAEYFALSGLFESFVVTPEMVAEARRMTPAEREAKEMDLMRWQIAERFELLLSKYVQKEITEPEFTKAAIELSAGKASNYENYSRVLKIDPEKLIAEASFSYWQGLEGLNRAIVADTGIKGRYHIFTTQHKAGGGFPIWHNWTVIENGRVIRSGSENLPLDLVQDLPNVVAFYEKVRNLDRFDPNNAPIVEFQTVGNNHVFLQYHRTRSMQASTFILREGPTSGQLEADFVRGATGPAGIELETYVWYPMEFGERIIEGESIPKEIASFDEFFPGFYEYSDIMSHLRQANFSNKSFEIMANHSVNGDHHLQRSSVFNPPLFVAVDLKKLLGDQHDVIQERNWGRGSTDPVLVRLHVVSDGTRAFVRYLGIKESSP